MAKQLYTDEINEFIDWVTGIDSTKDVNVTNNLLVSGESIRKYLLERLQKPFFGYYDKPGGKVRMFSSRKAYELWELDPETYANLEIFSFTAVSEYEFTVKNLLTGTHYIRKGDPTQTNAKVKFEWGLKRGNTDYTDDNGIIASYSITNGNNAAKTFSRRYTDASKPVEENIYDYLGEGENHVSVKLQSNSTNATFSGTYNLIMITLSINSSFQFLQQISNLSSTSSTSSSIVNKLDFRVQVTRNVNADGTMNIYVDNALFKQYNVYSGTDIYEAVLSRTELFGTDLNNPKIAAGLHTLQVYVAQFIDGLYFYSNLLYYTFVTTDTNTDIVKYINYWQSLESANGTTQSATSFTLNAVQYETFTLPWSYYTNDPLIDTSINVNWELISIQKNLIEGDSVIEILQSVIDDSQLVPSQQNYSNIYEITKLQSLIANTGLQSKDLVFMPSIYTEENEDTYLMGTFNNTVLVGIPIRITKSSLTLEKVEGEILKLSAYGRANASNTADVWEGVDSGSSVVALTTFLNITWNETSGWYLNSFRTTGSDLYAQLEFNCFSNVENGCAIDFEFESENVQNADDTILFIGDLNRTNYYIIVTTTSATLYYGNRLLVKTNFKQDERIKLCFSIFPDNYIKEKYQNLATIYNNGIMERASLLTGTRDSNSGNNDIIKIGGSSSGIKFYNIKVYDKPLTYKDAYNIYVSDSENKVQIISRNNVLVANEISMNLCQNYLDVIKISTPYDGVDLYDPENGVLKGKANKDAKQVCVVLRYCVYDPSKNFIITNGLIRQHGQSTLNYPVPSLKIWSDNNPGGYKKATKNSPMVPGNYGEPKIDYLNVSLFNYAKKRYSMKDGAIPANKWVLQANYADSSGVHNGGIERLIQDTWYKARVNGEFVLRTPPQLFASNSVYHRLDGGVDGYSNVTDGGVLRYNNKQWKDLNENEKGVNDPSAEFPYEIRISPDSFPCVVFIEEDYPDAQGKTLTVTKFLGLYVFMDDKKSDYIYGERSIYKFASDPFCLTNTYASKDEDENLCWDNDDVLRIEVLNVDTVFTSYMSNTDSLGLDFTTFIPQSAKVKAHYRWEEDFELIYPDPDDIDNGYYGTYTGAPKKTFERKTKPFVDWFEWLVSTHGNHTKFRAEANLHLDLYKLAAYYIFVLRFGLVDSLERNVQIKTYDGQHFWYEPWDMDIALGNKNDGGIAFDPPITRDTKLNSTTWALSGRSETTSNWLFDALEAWTSEYDGTKWETRTVVNEDGTITEEEVEVPNVVSEGWIDGIVPKVAQALYDAGLTYDNAIKMLDSNYADYWCETIYNMSGEFKYIEQRGESEDDVKALDWLQGARTTHRHWWLKTSFDYYDAKWGIGNFKNYYIYITADRAAGIPGYIYVTPYTSTSISMTKNYMDIEGWGTLEVSPAKQAKFDLSITSLSTKTPLHIYGAHFIKDFDISALASAIKSVLFEVSSSGTLSNLKNINMGTPLILLEEGDPGYVAGKVKYTSVINESVSTFTWSEGAWQHLETLNIRGLNAVTSLNFMNRDWYKIHTFYAMGTSLLYFNSAASGNNFQVLELPDTVETLTLKDSTFNNLSFWHTDFPNNNNIGVYTEYKVSGVTYSIPETLKYVNFTGTTGKQECSKNFVLDWLACIQHQIDSKQTEEEKALVDFSTKSLKLDGIYWTGVTYEQLEKIAQMQHDLRGYICMTGEQQPTSAQLTQLSTWFGTSVFVKGSSGLVIDYMSDFIGISVDTSGDEFSGVGHDPNLITQYGQSSDEYIYIREGYLGKSGVNGLLINATKFRLSELSTNVTWELVNIRNALQYSRSNYKSLWLRLVNNSAGNESYYIYAIESTNNNYSDTSNQDYYVKLRATINNADGSSIPPQEIVIKVITATYPSEYIIKYNQANGSNQSIKQIGEYLVLSGNGAYAEFYADPSITNYTATFKSVAYNVFNSDNQPLSLENFTPIANTAPTLIGRNNEFYWSTESLKGKYPNLIKIGLSDIVLTPTPQVFTIKAYVKIGARTNTPMQCSRQIMALSDEPILSISSAQVMLNISAYPSIIRCFNELFPDNQLSDNPVIFVSTMCSLSGNLVLRESDLDNGGLLTNVLSDLREPIWNYGINLTGLVLDGCTNIANSYTYTIENEEFSRPQMYFNSGNKLKVLSTVGCTALTTLDYTNLTLLENLNQSGCDNVGFTVVDLSSNHNVQTVNLSGCTNLSSLNLAGCSELNTLDLQNTNSLATVALPINSAITSIKLANPTTLVISLPASNIFETNIDIVNNNWTSILDSNSAISFQSVSELSSLTLDVGNTSAEDTSIRTGAIATLCRILDAKYSNNGGE